MDLETMSASLVANAGGRIAKGRLRRAHLRSPRLPLPPRGRGSAPELGRARARRRGALPAVGRRRGLPVAARRRSASSVSPTELATPRPLASPFLRYSAETASELAIARAAHELQASHGAQALPHYIISKTGVGLRPARGDAPDAGGGAAATGRRAHAPRSASIPLFETIDDLRYCDDDPAALPRRPQRHGDRAGELGRRRRGHARLLRQQQGRRVPDVVLGALQGRDAPRGAVPRSGPHPAPLPRSRRLRRVAAGARPTTPSSRSRRGRCPGRSGSTEQGEVIAGKYADREVGRRNLETIVAATLEATLIDTESRGDAAAFRADDGYALAERLRRVQGARLRDAGFNDYFRAATPISEIADLNLGSRPASRKASNRIEDLRAIPWVFSWAQSRVLLPGWYGFGTAVTS